MQCFASPIAVPIPALVSVPALSKHCHGSRSRPRVRCVAEKPADSAVARKNRRTQREAPYRILSDSEPRPPLPPKHNGIVLGGYLLEPILGMGNSVTRAKRYGGIYRSNFFVLPEQVFINDYDAIVACTRDSDIFSSNDVFYPSANLFGSGALFMLDGADHELVRNALAPAFSPVAFPTYMPMFVQSTRAFWDHVVADTVTNGSRFGKVQLDPRFREHYLALTIELTTGLSDSDAVAARLRDRMNVAQTMMYGPPFGPLFQRALRARDALLRDLEQLIRDTLVTSADEILRLREYGDALVARSGREVATGCTNMLLVLLAQTQLSTVANADNDPEEVARVARLLVVLWFAGYMTSAATTSCAVFEAARDPVILRALRDEQRRVSDADDGELTFAQLNSMPLLDSYVTEVLRMHPPIPGVHRKPKVDVQILGHHIPAGTSIFFEFEPSMMDNRIYPDAHRLIPARFVRSESSRPPPRILSFGASGDVHYCIGASLGRVLIKLTLAVWLREYDIQLDPSQSTAYSYFPEDSPKDRVRVNTVRRLHPDERPT